MLRIGAGVRTPRQTEKPIVLIVLYRGHYNQNQRTTVKLVFDHVAFVLNEGDLAKVEAKPGLSSGGCHERTCWDLSVPQDVRPE